MTGQDTVAIDNGRPDALMRLSKVHADILRNCARLEQCERKRGTQLAPAAFQEIIDFFDNEVVIHHRIEDEVLFPQLLALHLPVSDMRELRALVAALGEDHRMLDALWRDLRSALVESRPGASGVQLPDIATFAASYRQHLKREDLGILPFARRHLDNAALAAMTQAVEREISTRQP